MATIEDVLAEQVKTNELLAQIADALLLATSAPAYAFLTKAV